MFEQHGNDTPVILLVDDAPARRRSLCSDLAELEVKIVETDRDDAAAAFGAHLPLLVLIDVRTSGRGGFDTCTAIRNLPGGTEAAIVTFTEPDDHASIARSYEAGATDFIAGALDPQVVAQRVRHLLRSQREYAALRRGRRVVEERIRQLSYYDELTGLPNRQHFMESTRRGLREAERLGEGAALLYTDLDMFKKVNDALGHSAGDHLLREIADRFDDRADDFAAMAGLGWDLELSRLGGDEFVIFVRGAYTDKDLSELARYVLSSLADPVRIDDREFYVTGSMGIACYPQDGENLDTLLKHADTALYRAKHTGRNRFLFYTKAMSAEMLEKLSLGSKLKKALENDEFSLHYQPQIRTTDGRVMGVEALLRWRCPELGNVPPAAFIPVAEDTGMIDRIGEWVMNEACRQAAEWRNHLGVLIKMSVNLSSRQFQDADLLKTVGEMLARHQLVPASLELEITESTIMQEVDEARATLEALRDLGVQVSIDDFGTGYSSMSYLKSLPLDTLKIDRSFITDVSTDPDTAAIARAILAMARQLGLNTIAEGVETLAQFAFLQEHECDEIQGYLVGRPMPAEEAGQFLHSFGRGGWKLDPDLVAADDPLLEPVMS